MESALGITTVDHWYAVHPNDLANEGPRGQALLHR